MAPGPTHRKLTANYHLLRNVCVYKLVDLGKCLSTGLAWCSTHYPCVCSSGCSIEGAHRSIKPGAFVHPQHCPVVWSVPPSLLTCHAHVYSPLTSWGIATPMHSPWLWFSFLVIRATLPTHFVEPCALGRWVWVCGKAAGSATPPPHTLSSQQNPPKTKYILCMPQAWLQRYNYKKKTTVSLLINMRQAQELIGHE